MPAIIEKIPLANPSHGGDSRGARPLAARAPWACFIAGEENRIAVAAVRAWMRIAEFQTQTASFEAPDERLAATFDTVSPLVLHGPSGCGKTHLARGLIDWLGKRSLAPGMFLTAAEFAGQFHEALECDGVAAWRQKTRNPSWLVVEDLWQIAGKSAVQYELVQLLDACAARPAPVIVTMRNSPAAAAGLVPALASRLCEGLSAPVLPPAPATRRALLAEIWSARGGERSTTIESAFDLLAAELDGGAAELQGALLAVEHAARVEKRAIDGSAVRAYLTRSGRKAPTLRDIAIRTARHYEVTLADLKSTSRRRNMVTARDMAMYLARQLTDSTLEQIGAFFGGRDHTTVLHGCRQVEALVKSDPATQRDLRALRVACSTRGSAA